MLVVGRGSGIPGIGSEGSSEKFGSDQEVVWQRLLKLKIVLYFIEQLYDPVDIFSEILEHYKYFPRITFTGTKIFNSSLEQRTIYLWSRAQ